MFFKFLPPQFTLHTADVYFVSPVYKTQTRKIQWQTWVLLFYKLCYFLPAIVSAVPLSGHPLYLTTALAGNNIKWFETAGSCHMETKKEKQTICTHMHVFGLRVESGEPKENPCSKKMPTPRRKVAGPLPLLPDSEICCCPCLVEVTTTAAMSLTCREACCSVYSFLLLRSAFTCKDTSAQKPQIYRHLCDLEQTRWPLQANCKLHCTFEAETSCAVLPAISCEQAMSSSYLPFSPVTRSAESLPGRRKRGMGRLVEAVLRNQIPCKFGEDSQQLCGAPANSFGGRDESLCPARVLGVELGHRRCPLWGIAMQKFTRLLTKWVKMERYAWET